MLCSKQSILAIALDLVFASLAPIPERSRGMAGWCVMLKLMKVASGLFFGRCLHQYPKNYSVSPNDESKKMLYTPFLLESDFLLN